MRKSPFIELFYRILLAGRQVCVIKETVSGTPLVRSGRIRLKPRPEFAEGSFGGVQN
jgi:hypothetical protein